MDCPKCNSEMQELKIETLHGQVIIDKCNNCKGLWFDYSELGPIVRHTPPPSSPLEAVSCSEGIDCPKCDERLAPFNYAHDSGILINKCTSFGQSLE